MKTKLLALLLVLVMAVGVFAACTPPASDPCTNHVDANKDGICDNDGCGASVAIPKCDECVDADDNGKCDVCKRTVVKGCQDHRDTDGDGLCNSCGQPYDIWDDRTVEWDSTSLIFQMTNNSNDKELSSTCAQYMAGEGNGDGGNIDTLVQQRNDAAKEKTKVTVKYEYYQDNKSYNWGECIDDMTTLATGTYIDGTTPDMYCNFVYDMIAASFAGAFNNLYADNLGSDQFGVKNYFQFQQGDYTDSGNGYMVEYMQSLTLSETKMYCLSSDYFTDMVRAFFVVPVSVTLMNSIEVNTTDPDAFNADRTGDQQFTIADFYKLVDAQKWNYETLAAFSQAITVDSGADTATKDLDDQLGFAISTSSGLSASGMMYTTPIEIIRRDPGTVDAWYPNPLGNDAEDRVNIDGLISIFDNISNLFKNNEGIIAISDVGSGKWNNGTDDALQAIRNQFSANKVLFGGVVCLGSLEYDEYQEMSGGFGVVPVPLFRSVNPETNQPDKYLTQIHNIGRIGAIAKNTTKFVQCTAFLDYMSTHSSDVLNEYYDVNLKLDVAGDSKANGNEAMLDYIRANVRSSFDKAFEDAIGQYTQSENDKWHMILMNESFIVEDIGSRYNDLYTSKRDGLETIVNLYPGLPE